MAVTFYKISFVNEHTIERRESTYPFVNLKKYCHPYRFLGFQILGAIVIFTGRCQLLVAFQS